MLSLRSRSGYDGLVAHQDLFGERSVDRVEPWLQQTVDTHTLRDSPLWNDDFGDAEISDVATVLRRYGIRPAAEMRLAVADVRDEMGALLLVAALAAGASVGLRGRVFAMPIGEQVAPVAVVLEAGRCTVSRISLDAFSAASQAFDRGAPLPVDTSRKPAAGSKRGSKARTAGASKSAASIGPITVRRLTASQYDREYPRQRVWPPAGAFPEGTSSRPAPDGGFLGVSSAREVWTFFAGRAARVDGLVAAGPLQTDVGLGGSEVVSPQPIYDVCFGPPGRLITMGRDAVLRLLSIESGAPNVVAELPFRDEPGGQEFPLHRIQSLPGGRACLCIAYDRGPQTAPVDGSTSSRESSKRFARRSATVERAALFSERHPRRGRRPTTTSSETRASRRWLPAPTSKVSRSWI